MSVVALNVIRTRTAGDSAKRRPGWDDQASDAALP
jgi:hypothetical protein